MAKLAIDFSTKCYLVFRNSVRIGQDFQNQPFFGCHATLGAQTTLAVRKELTG